MRHSLLLVFLGMLTLPSESVLAGQGEQDYSLSFGHLGSANHGFESRASLSVALSDYWKLRVSGIHGWAPVEHAANLHQLGGEVGIDAQLDALTWVPYLSFANGIHTNLSAPESNASYSIRIGIGVDYRRWRRFAVGLYSGYCAFISGPIGSYLSSGLRFTIYR